MRGVGETFFVSKQALRFLGPSAQGRRNARVKASLRSTSRNICMDLKAKNDVSPYPLHLRAEKRDRLPPCLQRPCRWALHVYTFSFEYGP